MLGSQANWQETFSLWLQRNTLYRVTLPLAIGILIASWFPVVQAKWDIMVWVGIVLWVGVGLYGEVFLRKKRRVNALVSVGLSLVACAVGFLLMEGEIRKVSVVWPKEKQAYAVRLLGEVKERNQVWQVQAEIEHGEFAGRKLLLTLMKSTEGQEGTEALDARGDSLVLLQESLPEPRDIRHSEPLPGDRIWICARLQQPRNMGNPGEFDYAGWLQRQGISGVAFLPADKWQEQVSDGIPWAQRMLRFRKRLAGDYLQHLDERQAAIIAAMTLGDKGRMDAQIRAQFSRTGTNHVLALSGLHLGILYSIFNWLILRRCQRRSFQIAMSFCGIAFLWGYAFLTGFPLSLVRAAVMFSLMQLATCFRRDISSFNSLAFAALLLLLASPQALFDVGFQLSFLSVFCILTVTRNVTFPLSVCRCPWLHGLLNLLLVSFAAQVGTAPLVAYYFHTVSFVGLLTNLLVIPMAYVLLVLALLFFLLPFGKSVVASCLGTCISLLDGFLAFCAQLPGASCDFHPTGLDVMLCYAVIGAIVFFMRFRAAAMLYAASALIVVWCGVNEWESRSEKLTPRVVVYHHPSVPMVHAIHSSSRSYLWTTDTLRVKRYMSGLERTYWREHHMSPPRLMPSRDGEVFEETKSACWQRGNALFFHGCTLVLLGAGRQAPVPAVPQPVDFLIIANGCNLSVNQLLRHYRPGAIILDGSLKEYAYCRYCRQLEDFSIPVVDVRENGAYVIKVEPE